MGGGGKNVVEEESVFLAAAAIASSTPGMPSSTSTSMQGQQCLHLHTLVPSRPLGDGRGVQSLECDATEHDTTTPTCSSMVVTEPQQRRVTDMVQGRTGHCREELRHGTQTINDGTTTTAVAAGCSNNSCVVVAAAARRCQDLPHLWQRHNNIVVVVVRKFCENTH